MLDRTQPPKATAITKLNLLSPEKHTIQPHLPLFALYDTSQPVVQLDFLAPKGIMHTRLEKTLPHFLVKTIVQGTKSKKQKEIANYIDQYGASLDAMTGTDTLKFRLTTLTKHFHHLLPLFAEILHQPSFPQEALALEKKIEKQEIRLKKATPQSLASQKLAEHVFGANHPYGYNMEEKDLSLVTHEKLYHTFYTQAWHPGVVILSGAIDASIISATQNALKTLPQKPLEKPSYHALPNLNPLNIRKEKAVQTSIVMGMPTITRTHPDYPLLYILNVLFGGYFGSRLMQNIREKKGYTYGIGSRLSPYLYDGYFYIATETKVGFAQKTCEEIGHEIKILHDTPVPIDELQNLKEFLNGNLLASFDNIFSLAAQLASIYFHGLDLTFYDALYQTIQTVTPEDLQHTAQKYLDTTRFSQVIVGS